MLQRPGERHRTMRPRSTSKKTSAKDKTHRGETRTDSLSSTLALLMLVPRLPLVVEAAVGQYRPVLQKNMSFAVLLGRMAAFSFGTDGRLHWYGWPPPLVRMAASIGTEV